jgi:hypothetical protein
MMTDSLHSLNSNPRNRVKGFASRGRGKKWILLLLVVLLLIPAMQVAVVRFINPPKHGVFFFGARSPKTQVICRGDRSIGPRKMLRLTRSCGSILTS